MEGWVLVALCAACLYTAMLVMACLSAGRRADDKLEEFGAELRVLAFGLGTAMPDVVAQDRLVSEACPR